MSIADIIHRKQLDLAEIDKTLSGINPKLSLAITLREKQERLIAEIRELEAQRTQRPQ